MTVLSNAAASEARAVGLALLEKLTPSAAVDAAADADFARFAPGGDRDRSSLAGGAAGFAVAFHAGFAVTQDERFLALGRERLKEALRARTAALGLMEGRAGILAAVELAQRVTGGLEGAREHLGAELLADWDRRRDDVPWSPAYAGHYDLISGIAGLALGLAYAGFDARSVAEHLAALSARETFAEPSSAGSFTAGFGTLCGMAHGLGGVLAALVAADAATSDVARVLDRVQAEASDAQPYRRWATARAGGERYDPGAWCTGTPGTAAAALAAAAALRRRETDSLRADLELALAEVVAADAFADDGLCHGRAGVMMIAAVLARRYGSVTAAHHATTLAARIAGRYDEGAPFGLRFAKAGTGADLPGFLEGSAGVAVALLTIAGGGVPDWSALLGLAQG